MPRNMDEQGAAALESLIDRHTLAEVLDTIAGICAGKAEHIRVNWNDKPLARIWDRLGARVSEAGDDAGKEGI